MKYTAVLCALVLAAIGVEGYAPKQQKVSKPDFGKAAAGAFAAFTIASSVLTAPVADAAIDFPSPAFSSHNIIADKEVRQGLYQDYEVDVTPQVVDDARSTFKGAKETKSKKGKYTAILAVLIVGSFVIPMAQYFWYVRDDDSSDRFFAEDVPEPPKKKGWF